MHTDERVRIEEMRDPLGRPYQTRCAGFAREPSSATSDRDGLYIAVLSATRSPDEIEQLAHRLLEAAAVKRAG